MMLNELEKAFLKNRTWFAASLVTGVAVVGCFRAGLSCQGTASPLGREEVG